MSVAIIDNNGPTLLQGQLALCSFAQRVLSKHVALMPRLPSFVIIFPACSDGCAECTGGAATECKKCKANMYSGTLNKPGGELVKAYCIAQCPQGTYADTASYKCIGEP